MNKKLIFVVGNSRSGTHLISRILGNHGSIYNFPHELHFIDELVSDSNLENILSSSEAKALFARLFDIHFNGYLTQDKRVNFADHVEKVLSLAETDNFSPIKVFHAFLFYIVQSENRIIPCDHTPRNVFYIKEILKYFPKAYVIHMVRDPRDILLSQKRKWRRRFLGAKKNIPLREAIRAWINYHPITISKLWNSSIRAANEFTGNERVCTLKFEQLLSKPEREVLRVCEFIGIDYDDNLLMVPQVGSSTEFDKPEERGIRKRAGSWKKGGLNSAEIYFCERICHKFMNNYGYELTNMKGGLLIKSIYFVTFLPKLILALSFNLRRINNIWATVIKRI